MDVVKERSLTLNPIIPYVQTGPFMNPIYLYVSIKLLSSQDWRYWFIITETFLKPITKTPTAVSLRSVFIQ